MEHQYARVQPLRHPGQVGVNADDRLLAVFPLAVAHARAYGSRVAQNAAHGDEETKENAERIYGSICCGCT